MPEIEPFLEHTYGQKVGGIDRCPLCPGPHGGAGPCDRAKYSAKHRRFVMAHLEEFAVAHYNPDKRYASATRARLNREEQTLPSRHFCSCRCPREGCPEWGSPTHSLDTHHCKGRPGPPCAECLNLRADQKPQEAAEIGRTSAVTAPMPSAEMLDLFAGLL